MKNILDTDGITFEEYVSQKADILSQLKKGMQSEIENGNDLFAEMYRESIENLEEDLANMSHDGICVLDYVKEAMNKTENELSL